jgi:hypothetical protein
LKGRRRIRLKQLLDDLKKKRILEIEVVEVDSSVWRTFCGR